MTMTRYWSLSGLPMVIQKTCPHCNVRFSSEDLHMCADTQDGDLLPCDNCQEPVPLPNELCPDCKGGAE